MCLRIAFAVIGSVSWSANLARAGGIEFSYHQATGNGTANVFDGGPPVSSMGHDEGPSDPIMAFGAFDKTMPGSYGASAHVYGQSFISEYEDGALGMKVELETTYHPSLFPGGDNPGGAAYGEVESVIEFIMPGDELPWFYLLDIDDSIVFDGSAQVVIENLTRSEVLLTLTSEVNPPIETTLVGQTGDLIRVTSIMSGGGSTGPASDRYYRADFQTLFLIPEPATALVLLAAAAYTFRRKQRQCVHTR